MKGCSVHYHQTLDLAESVDLKLIDPPACPIRNFREGIGDLISSIRERGLLQPIIIRPAGERFEVVAGARRLEACRKLRWGRVPCIVKDLSNQDAYEIALTENLQRKTMNAIEEANAFKRYIEQEGWGGETSLSRKIGKSQEYVSQRLALLTLPEKVKEKIIRHQIKPSVAQEIARIEDPIEQVFLSEEAASRHLTVSTLRETAKAVKHGEGVRDALKKASKKWTMEEEITEVSFGIETSEPDFAKSYSHEPAYNPKSEAIRDLDKSILVLKLALLRLDALIGGVSPKNLIKNVLLEKRILVHDIIDSLIREKIKVASKEDYQFIER